MYAELRSLVGSDPWYRTAYRRARATRSRVTTVFDLSSRCNLFCEGCLFFDRDGAHPGGQDSTESRFDALFAAEKRRGVTYPVCGGAEPMLEPQRIALLARHWGDGMIHTNGTRKPDPAHPFRLLVSLWGGPELSELWRGGNNYHKALRIATGDRRVLMNYTVNARNVGDIRAVVADCAGRGLRISFQGFGLTRDYTDYLADGAAGRHDFIQSDSPDTNLALTPGACEQAIAEISACIDAFPETVVFTRALARWTFGDLADALTRTTPDGIPRACIAGQDPRHRHYLVDGSQPGGKDCGHGNIDCGSCKTYTVIYPAFFRARLRPDMSRQDAVDFLEAHAVFDHIYNGHNRPDWTGVPSQGRAATVPTPA